VNLDSIKRDSSKADADADAGFVKQTRERAQTLKARD